MKRIALLLVASVAAVTLFTACNKPDDNTYYSEDIAVRWQYPAREFDTTLYFRQEFTMNGNALIYNTSSKINSERPYVSWQYDNPAICTIVNDSIIYFNRLHADHALVNFLFGKISAKVNWKGKKKEEFTFSYILSHPSFDDYNETVSATHTCHRIKSLSD